MSRKDEERAPAPPDDRSVTTLEQIRSPGAYLLLDSGALARFAEGGRRRRPRATPTGVAPLRVARLSADPDEETSVLRAVARSRQYPVAF